MALRCFVAVDIPEGVRQAIGGIIHDFRKTGADIKWVVEGNLHVTLKFLGSTGEDQVEAIGRELRKNLAPCRPFYIKLSGVGSFPGGRNPRVVWVGIQDTGGLEDLQRRVDAAMSGMGFPPEDRPFSPHLTIGRVRSGKGLVMLLKKMESVQQADFGEIDIRRVLLMKSELKPEGPRYTVIDEVELKRRKDDE